ncbi:MAG: inorganic phosphate transporter [Proteobacteria bacterium]|nr:inorganic phosphate transporter [Pseudomonadota bacterium]
MLSLLGGIFLGWSLGANDAANVFGSAVASRMVKFWTAAVLASVFVLLGALLEGEAGIETYRGLTQMTLQLAVISSVAAAITVTLMTLLGLPVSTSQAAVGAILGAGILSRQLNVAGLAKVVVCWFGTPIGGAVSAVFVYKILAVLYNRLNINLFQSDKGLRLCLIGAGSYGAYTLGANNVANVTAVFVSAGMLAVFSAALIGGLSISFGIMTFSRRVMETVGKRLVKLDAFSALVVVLAEAITVHFYTFVGVPVSTSQAVVGAVLGVGIIKGVNTIRRQTLVNILFGWFLTPVVACFFALAIHFASRLQYVPSP